MKTISFKVSALVMLIAFSTLSQAANDAKSIMEKVDVVQRETADMNLSLSTLSSCPFQIKSKKVSCTESKR
ncbi:hypothetical protein, partial [Oleiphilus sp. HI0128]